MKYETLKKTVASHVYNSDSSINWAQLAQKINLQSMIATGTRKTCHTLHKELKDKVWDAIMLVDIRCIKTLIEIAPSVVPAWIKSGNYYFDLTDNGWEILKPESDY